MRKHEEAGVVNYPDLDLTVSFIDDRYGRDIAWKQKLRQAFSFQPNRPNGGNLAYVFIFHCF